MKKKIYAFRFYSFLIILEAILIVCGIISGINDEPYVWFGRTFNWSIRTILLFAFAGGIFCLLIVRIQCFNVYFDPKSVSYLGFPYFPVNKKSNNTLNLDEWNNNVFLIEVESIEIVKLKKNERKYVIGGKTIFHKYLKFNLPYNKQKYIHISMFASWQVKKILMLIQKLNPKIQIIKQEK